MSVPIVEVETDFQRIQILLDSGFSFSEVSNILNFSESEVQDIYDQHLAL